MTMTIGLRNGIGPMTDVRGDESHNPDNEFDTQTACHEVWWWSLYITLYYIILYYITYPSYGNSNKTESTYC
jgi:hypothetical protein